MSAAGLLDPNLVYVYVGIAFSKQSGRIPKYGPPKPIWSSHYHGVGESVIDSKKAKGKMETVEVKEKKKVI